MKERIKALEKQIYPHHINKYGLKKQIAKMLEECIEFTNAYFTWEDSPSDENYEALLSEAADVWITTKQVKKEENRVLPHILYKLERQFERESLNHDQSI